MAGERGVKGGDVSHHNPPSDVIARIKKDGLKFLIIKASEGRTYVDPKADYFNKVCELNNIMPGFYHYARPENNSAEKEAFHFCTTVENIIGKINENNDGVLLALDWEGEALKHSFEWAITWCDMVYEITGIKPLIYTGYSYIKTDLRNTASEDIDYGLWCARWNNTPLIGVNDVKPWKHVAIHQYTDTKGKFDYDVFNGSEERLRLYGKSSLSGIKEEGTRPCQCGCCEH